MINIDTVTRNMIEAMEMLKNNKDPKTSENERMDVETAKAMACLGKVAIDGFKVKAQVCSMMAKAENPKATREFVQQSGIIDVPLKSIEG